MILILQTSNFWESVRREIMSDFFLNNSPFIIITVAGQLLFVNSDVIQEFLPRGVSAYGDGLENGQLLHIPLGDVNQSLLFTYFANVTKGCSWTNVTL